MPKFGIRLNGSAEISSKDCVREHFQNAGSFKIGYGKGDRCEGTSEGDNSDEM